MLYLIQQKYTSDLRMVSSGTTIPLHTDRIGSFRRVREVVSGG